MRFRCAEMSRRLQCWNMNHGPMAGYFLHPYGKRVGTSFGAQTSESRCLEIRFGMIEENASSNCTFARCDIEDRLEIELTISLHSTCFITYSVDSVWSWIKVKKSGIIEWIIGDQRGIRENLRCVLRSWSIGNLIDESCPTITRYLRSCKVYASNGNITLWC